MNKYYSEIIYGGVDGLITTFAIIAGSMGANIATSTIIILGLASILSDGFSMGVSSYLAENERKFNKNPIKVGLITFLSFILIGIFPLIPFFFDFEYKYTLSTIVLFLLLFLLGYIKESKLVSGIRTLLIGGAAALIAFYSAKLISENI